LGKPSAIVKANGVHDIAQEWKIWTPDEIYADLAPVDWLVGGVIARGQVGILAAYGSSLKSWAELDLLDALSEGRPWLGRFDCKPCRALVIDYEAGSRELRRRLKRIARAHGRARAERVSFVSMPPHFITDPAWMERVERLAEDYGLIAIDTLPAASPNEDENDTRFAAPLNLLKPIAERTGCVFKALHHTRKSREGDDDRETTRGTGALYNACDFELKLFRVKGEDGLFKCKHTKSRCGKEVAPFGVRVLDDDDGGTRVIAVELLNEDGAEDVVAKATGGIELAKRKILVLLAKHHDIRSGNEIQRRIKGTKKTNLEAIAELEERKLIVRHEGTLRLASEVKS
jgi:hypothetical protein